MTSHTRGRDREQTERVTVRLPESLDDELDRAVESGRYHCKSEAIREALRLRFTPIDGRDP